jgi:hypothetical protein
LVCRHADKVNLRQGLPIGAMVTGAEESETRQVQPIAPLGSSSEAG